MREISKAQQQKSKTLRDSLAKKFNEREAKDFIAAHQDKRWYDDFVILYNMMRTKDYVISNKTKNVIAGTLAYVVLPLDSIPDFIPVAGWLDDVFVLNLAIATLNEEIKSFKLVKEINEKKV
mgnify:FL=1